MRTLLLFFAFPSLALALFGEPDWNTLEVTWSRDCDSPRAFAKLPQKASDAQQQGWTQISDCWGNSHFAGQRYAKDGDMAVVLLYDKNGYIAGIQSGFPTSEAKNYPTEFLTNTPIVYDDGHQFITAYFTDPVSICTEGRSAEDFRYEGVGSALYLQNGSTPASAMKLPATEIEANKTSWVKGHCFKTMGNHWWYDISEDMDCDTFLPMFLLYNGGRLNSFGWAFFGNYTSDRFEHPIGDVFGSFLNPVPKCLYDVTEGFSTMHIYMSDPLFCQC